MLPFIQSDIHTVQMQVLGGGGGEASRLFPYETSSFIELGKVPVLPKHHDMKTFWGVEVYLHTFLTSELDGGEWSASRPGRFNPRETAPYTHWIWVGWAPEPVWTRW
jgi:hypothetical protein